MARAALLGLILLAGPPEARFARHTLDLAFRSEGVAVADFTRDGVLDVAAGYQLYMGPDYRPVPLAGEPKSFNPEGYSDAFLCFAEDLDGDGWLDLIVVGFPGAETRWLRNPGAAGGPWPWHKAIERTHGESPWWIDVDADGRNELAFMADSGVALASPGADPTAPWPIRVVGGPDDPRPGHGLGVGDVNGDGRADLICPEAWWEQPVDATTVPWPCHRAKLGDPSPAQMPVMDVDGDGDADILSCSAHGYGIVWAEQTADGWRLHEIDQSVSQTHALHLADLNGDGLLDFVTGKRFWAHRQGDPGIDEPSILMWFELRREGGRPSWVRHVLDEDSGVGLHVQLVDLNGDGRMDIASANKKGVNLFVQEP